MVSKCLIHLILLCFLLVQTGCDGAENETNPNTPVVVPTLGVSPFSVTEGDNVSFTVTLNKPQIIPVSFYWTISQITAPTLGRFSLLSSSVTIPAGVVSYQVPLPVINDTFYEGNQTYTMTLSMVTNGVTIPTPSVTFTLIDDELPGPFVTQVSSTQTDGSYRAGTIPITMQFSEAVIVSGSPTLKLETGPIDQTATYASGSGTSSLTFNYTVQSGDVTSDLDYFSSTALSFSGGTITSIATGLNGQLRLPTPGAPGSLGANKNILIDTIAPTVTNITSSVANGAYSTNSVIPISVTFSKVVTVTGTPVLSTSTGRSVNYASGSGTNTLTFNYTVLMGDISADLDCASTTALTGTIKDAIGNTASLLLPVPGAFGSLGSNKNIVIDPGSPSVTSVSATTANGYYKAGSFVDLTVTFSKPVIVTGTPRLQLETGVIDEYSSYLSGSGTATLTFRYTVISGDTTVDLDYLSTAALTLSGGTILDSFGNVSLLALPAVSGPGSLGANRNIVIDTTPPTAPGSVVDGTWTTLLSQAPTVTWTASTDATSAISRYEFAIGTSAGASDIVPWTSNALTLLRTQTGLTLVEGTYYYASVRAVDLAGNVSLVSCGDGFRADVTPPTQPATLDDGVTSASLTQTPPLTWGASTDSLSGLGRYEIAIGTSAGATNTMNWTSVGTVTTTTITGLSLTEGLTYFASVRAVDQAGNVGLARSGDGWTIGWLQQAYLKAVNNDAADSFGESVAISGDTMVVGVSKESSNQTTITNGATASANNSAAGSGAVYVYVRTGTTWTQQAYIKASNAAAGDAFGKSVAIDGDTIVVGAPLEDSTATGVSSTVALGIPTATDSGAVYIYKRTGTTWVLEAYAKASNSVAGIGFGSSVAINANTVVVGAPSESSNATGTSVAASGNTATPGAGAAYVYTRSGTTWSLESYLKSATNRAVAFGTTVSVSVDTIAVGAPFDSSNLTSIVNGTGGSNNTSKSNSGAAYVFTRSATVWTQQAYMKASNADAADKFGSTISVSGDLVVVGAPYESSNVTGASATTSLDNSKAASGAAYVYSRTGTTWTEESYLKAANSTAGNHFGTSVAIEGSLILVGAPDENASDTSVIQGGTASSNLSASSSGAAYLYRRTGTSWAELAYLKAPNTDSGDALGASCAISGSSLAVGATLEDSSQTTITNGASASANNSSLNSGAVYLFNR